MNTMTELEASLKCYEFAINVGIWEIVLLSCCSNVYYVEMKQLRDSTISGFAAETIAANRVMPDRKITSQ